MFYSPPSLLMQTLQIHHDIFLLTLEASASFQQRLQEPTLVRRSMLNCQLFVISGFDSVNSIQNVKDIGGKKVLVHKGVRTLDF